MAVITRLVASRSRSGQVRVYLDGKYAFSLEADVALEAGLQPRQELDRSKIDKLGRQNRIRKALASSDKLLAFRPRSEKELRQKLKQKGYEPALIDEAVDHLKEHGLIDDAAFARYWTENRVSFSPRSRRMVQLELRKKGIAADLADEASQGLDDAEAACQAGAKKAARMDASIGYEEFRRKLGDYLRRRGFEYEVIDRSLKRLWQEKAHKE